MTGIHKSFGKRAILSGIDIEIRAAEILLIVGINGVGKSTLMDILTGIIHADSYGSFHSAIQRGEIGYMTSSDEFFEPMNTLSFLLFHSDYHGVPRTEAIARIESLLNQFGLSYALKEDFRNLSSGEKKRIRIVAAMLHRPRVVFLDEPFENCDYKQCCLIGDLIAHLRGEGTAVVVVAHNLEYVEDVYDRVLILKGQHEQISVSRKDIDGMAETSLKRIVRSNIMAESPQFAAQ
jgi:ABC-2 type transport system ATP-binding protein